MPDAGCSRRCDRTVVHRKRKRAWEFGRSVRACVRAWGGGGAVARMRPHAHVRTRRRAGEGDFALHAATRHERTHGRPNR
jgi:hypothetical protein